MGWVGDCVPFTVTVTLGCDRVKACLLTVPVRKHSEGGRGRVTQAFSRPASHRAFFWMIPRLHFGIRKTNISLFTHQIKPSIHQMQTGVGEPGTGDKPFHIFPLTHSPPPQPLWGINKDICHIKSLVCFVFFKTGNWNAIINVSLERSFWNLKVTSATCTILRFSQNEP